MWWRAKLSRRRKLGGLLSRPPSGLVDLLLLLPRHLLHLKLRQLKQLALRGAMHLLLMLQQQ
jgi:hypothetical protein